MTVLETDRLVLRPWRVADVDDLAPTFAEPAVWWFPFGRGLTLEETERFVNRQMAHFETHGFSMLAAELKGTGRLVGFAGLMIPAWLPEVLPAVEVGWRLCPDVWGRGLATEAGGACLRFGFDEVGLDRIISIYVPENTASGRVMTKLGMRDFQATTDRAGVPILVREITAVDWRAGRAATG